MGCLRENSGAMKGEPGICGNGIRLGEGRLFDLVAAACEEDPDRLMAATGDDAITYGEGCRLILALGRWLADSLHLGPGSRVLAYLPNCAAAPVLLASFELLGVRLVLRAPSLAEENLGEDCRLIGPDLVVLEDEGLLGALVEAGAAVPYLLLRSDNPDSFSVATLRKCLAEEPSGDLSGPSRAWLAGAAPASAELVLFTSGSSGAPKGVLNRFGSFHYNARRLAAALGMKAEDRLYGPSPIFHVYGFMGIFTALSAGATWVSLAHYALEESLALQRLHRVTVLFFVPTMVIRELAADRENLQPIESIRLCMVAGDGCAPEALQRFEQYHGCVCVLSYGMTETAATLTVESPAETAAVRFESSGPAIEGVTLAVDESTGEILAKTPSVMTGLIDFASGEVRGFPRNRWFRTGDIGSLDKAGRLCVMGRLKNVIVRGGANIHPAQLERCYRNHPAIDQCVVLGYPDAELGQRIGMFVAGEAAKTVSSAELRAFGVGKLEKGSVPDRFIHLEEIPTLPSGKPDYEALRRLLP